MHKSKKILVILLVVGFCSCGGYNWSYFYPYCKINPNHFQKNLPNNYEDCLNQFDCILSNEIISHFQSLDSTIAAIEISQAIGGLFVNFWNLKYYQIEPHENYIFRNDYKPLVLSNFRNEGLYDPEAMVRVLFRCYHKKLNNVPYNWKEEIQLIKSYWIPSEYGDGWRSKEMRKRDDEILVDYHFQQLDINDTVDILYNRAPRLIKKTPDWYYLTGIIQYKIPEQKAINVKLIDIKSDLGKNYMLIENDKIMVGDTMTDYSKGWLKRGIFYMNYHTNKEFRH